MNITKENNELVIRLPLEQDALDYTDNKVGTIPAILGVIAGDEQGICGLIDMTYKGKGPQMSDFIVKTCYSRDDFIKKCEEWGIDFFEYPTCGFCHKAIFGSFTMEDGKNMCWGCELKMERKTVA